MKTHQVYGPSAILAACGREVTSDLKTALPGKKVTCSACNKEEKARRQARKKRKIKK